MKLLNYFLIFCKRLQNKPSFLFIILLIPISSFLIMHFSRTETTGVNVVIYADDSDTLSSEMEKYLLDFEGIINFESVNSAGEVYDLVKTRKADCGYIFPKDLTERLADNVKLGAIESVSSPGSTMTAVANEFVITAFTNAYSYDLLKEYTLNSEDFAGYDETEIDHKLRAYYEKYLISGDTFSFEYENEHDNYVGEIDIIPELLIHSACGICALFIFISALAGGLTVYKDKSMGIFSVFKPFSKALLQYMDIFAPTMICGMAALISIMIMEGLHDLPIDILKTMGYIFLCSGFCFVLKLIIPSPVIYASSLPVWIIGSIIFCPVFIDIPALIPKLTTFKYLFLPTYYLNSATFSTTLTILICGIVISILGILTSYRLEKRL